MMRWLPSEAGNTVSSTVGAPDNGHAFAGWGELYVIGGYVVVLLVVASLLFARRDA
jgi:hypothetical protein